MMNYKYLVVLSVILVGCLAARCSHQGWTLHGQTSCASYNSAWLMDGTGNRVDSVPVQDGEFSMNLADHVEKPQVMTVRLVNDNDTDDCFSMPVVVETGVVNLNIGDYLLVGGTKLNDDLQSFLDALQACHDRCLQQPDMTAEEITRTFSDFYLQQITLHHKDVLGHYIFENYGTHLDAKANRQAKKLLNIQ